MERTKTLIEENKGNLPVFLIAGAVVSGFNCLYKADYNFVIYIYMICIWLFMNGKLLQGREKITSFFILLYSLAVDCVWILYWRYTNIGWKENPNKLKHDIFMITIWIGEIIKAIILLIIGISEWKTIRSFLPGTLVPKYSREENKEYNQHLDEY